MKDEINHIASFHSVLSLLKNRSELDREDFFVTLFSVRFGPDKVDILRGFINDSDLNSSQVSRKLNGIYRTIDSLSKANAFTVEAGDFIERLDACVLHCAGIYREAVKVEDWLSVYYGQKYPGYTASAAVIDVLGFADTIGGISSALKKYVGYIEADTKKPTDITSDIGSKKRKPEESANTERPEIGILKIVTYMCVFLERTNWWGWGGKGETLIQIAGNYRTNKGKVLSWKSVKAKMGEAKKEITTTDGSTYRCLLSHLPLLEKVREEMLEKGYPVKEVDKAIESINKK